ncbi:42461_t:CDS:2 [Gigaspora margarita]|uniref:42461_t:CDS:1 n=1 Tax=Gigaspora margarita TaxID=4874 RepID=A0ABN7UTW2_GIGMA|nr:42461_t:CDS:2 [Gigaspora margarita]
MTMLMQHIIWHIILKPTNNSEEHEYGALRIFKSATVVLNKLDIDIDLWYGNLVIYIYRDDFRYQSL